MRGLVFMYFTYYRYHMAAFFLGFLLDLLLGDPYGMPHPVRLIGKLIAGGEKRIRSLQPGRDGEKGAGDKARANRRELLQGAGLAVFVLVCVTAFALFLLALAYWLHPYAGLAAECVMTYQMLAVKSLKSESMKVYKCLKSGDMEKARLAVSMIVGRDTQCLGEEGVAKAAVETVAENTSDGVIAPMLYLAAGGPVLGFFYKAVNTMDSMIGYKNERYLYFGRAAAKLDDVLNYIPARVSAYLMILCCMPPDGQFCAKRAWAVYRRDRRNHQSPNSAQTESVCAGALGIRLAGDARYFGKVVRKPYIGDALRNVEYEDIRRANRLLYRTAWLCECLCLLGMAAFGLVLL